MSTCRWLEQFRLEWLSPAECSSIQSKATWTIRKSLPSNIPSQSTAGDHVTRSICLGLSSIYSRVFCLSSTSLYRPYSYPTIEVSLLSSSLLELACKGSQYASSDLLGLRTSSFDFEILPCREEFPSMIYWLCLMTAISLVLLWTISHALWCSILDQHQSSSFKPTSLTFC